jgi:hypothetical protein
MRLGSKRRPASGKKSRFQQSRVYTLSTAKAYLGRLLQRARNGEEIYIIRGRERFLLQAVPDLEPIPIRPFGYFNLDGEDLELDKKLAPANVIPQPDRE